jgi:hypothetical protein
VDEDEFWEFVQRLGGVADAASCMALELELGAAGRGLEFCDAVEVHVRRLLAACTLPEDLWGDSAEWLAAALIAAGRTTYEENVSSGARIDPDAWNWDESEALLSTGFPHEPGSLSASDLLESVASLQWNAEQVPDGVSTSWEPFVDMFGAGDDPMLGRSVVTDPEWDQALAQLGPDTGTSLHLALVVRDLPEAENLRWPEHHQVMRRVPVSEVLGSNSRRDVYLRELKALSEWA